MTLAAVELVLVRRKGPMMVACGLSPTPASDASPRAYLADPIGRALRALGQAGGTADPSDADCSGVGLADYDALYDAAELFTLEAVAGNFIQVDYTAGDSGRKLNQFLDGTLKLLDWKWEQVTSSHPQLKIAPIKRKASSP